MNKLVVGNGFLGQAVYECLRSSGPSVHLANRRPESHDNSHFIDLNRPETIRDVLEVVRPEVIINCAAILGRKPDEQVGRNPIFTRNLLEAASATNTGNNRIVILGSAAEYGPVADGDLPIHEDAPLNPSNAYGQSKKDETRTALELGDQHRLPVVVGRLFNPIGPGMSASYITSRILSQIKDIRAGHQEPTVQVRNLEAAQDYLHRDDCAEAIIALALAPELRHTVYNVGSGKSTSNETLIRLALTHSKMTNIEVKATDPEPEQLVGAVQADIRRLQELGWAPRHTPNQTMAWIVNAELSPYADAA